MGNVKRGRPLSSCHRPQERNRWPSRESLVAIFKNLTSTFKGIRLRESDGLVPVPIFVKNAIEVILTRYLYDSMR